MFIEKDIWDFIEISLYGRPSSFLETRKENQQKLNNNKDCNPYYQKRS